MKDSSQNVRLSSKCFPRRFRVVAAVCAAVLRVRRYGRLVMARCCYAAQLSAQKDGSEYSRLRRGGPEGRKARGSRADTFRYRSIHVRCGSNDA